MTVEGRYTLPASGVVKPIGDDLYSKPREVLYVKEFKAPQRFPGWLKIRGRNCHRRVVRYTERIRGARRAIAGISLIKGTRCVSPSGPRLQVNCWCAAASVSRR